MEIVYNKWSINILRQVYEHTKLASMSGLSVTILSTTEKKTRWEEEPEVEQEFAGDKTTFLDMVKWLKAARKYRCQFDGKDNIIVIWNKVENEL
jgi:hypothetical protein